MKLENEYERDKPNLNWQTNLLNYFCNFCDNTSIHGFKFLGERGGRYIIEKIWWFLIVVLALSGSGILIYNTYQKWLTSPVIVSLSTKELPISHIPFPAVTICPELKVDTRVFNYSDVFSKITKLQNLTPDENKLFAFLHMLCDDFGLDVINDFGFDASNETIDETDLSLLIYALADIETDDCKWMGKTESCDDILTVTHTAEGKCFSFNTLDSNDIYVSPGKQFANNKTHTQVKQWSLEYGYPPDADLNTYPLRTILAGSRTGFQIDLSVTDDQLDHGCAELQGFKVTLHHPAEKPDMDRHFRVPLNEAVFVAVKPFLINSTEEIKSYPPEKRGCYLPGEKDLSYFKIYTQQNCMSECLANYTKQRCGCVRYDMAEYIESDICNLRHRSCVEKAKISFLQNDDDLEFTDDLDYDDDEITQQCDCLPSCASIAFESETSQTRFDWKKTFKSIIGNQLVPKTVEGEHQARLVVYYKENQFMVQERHELYGTLELLANCGGLIGLMCGFSFISSIEILYYLTLRLFCNLKKFGRRAWSGESE